jgi:pimeloyl-ACP methyl ester carboxylesterase
VTTIIEANGITLGVEHFGDAATPLVLLAGATTMLSWPDALCEALARGGRHVVRYDLRDSGASTTVIPRPPRTRCAISWPTPRRSPVNSTNGRHTWRAARRSSGPGRS